MSKGALISSELTALVHWTIGRCTNEKPADAVKLGTTLVEAIQDALRKAYHDGAENVRLINGLGGGGGGTAHVAGGGAGTYVAGTPGSAGGGGGVRTA